MSKTTPEEVNEQMPEEVFTPLQRLRFYCSLAMSGQDWLNVEPFFKALDPDTDEVRRVDAEPVAVVSERDGQRGTFTCNVTFGTTPMLGDKIYIDPAPSQPAAPVELPVVGYASPNNLYRSRLTGISNGEQLLEPLVKLSDAQAAIAAGRKAS